LRHSSSERGLIADTLERMPSPRIGVVGHVEWVEFLPVDRFPHPGDIVHAREPFRRAAGGGGVVAGVLAQAGAEVDFYCALGDDPDGHAAAEQLIARGVRAHVAWRSEPTRRAVTLVETSAERTIVTIGERLEPLGSDDLDWGRMEGADGAYFTAGDVEALALARAAGVLVASARGRGALTGSDTPLDAVVYSRRDTGEREWAKLLEHRARLLVETSGAAGGRWWGESSGTWSAAPLPGEPRDAYGCGDSFAAGVTFGLASGMPVGEAAALGARWGARCLTRTGAP
jgi:ribokinase